MKNLYQRSNLTLGKQADQIFYNCKIKFLPNEKYKLVAFSFPIFREKGYKERTYQDTANGIGVGLPPKEERRSSDGIVRSDNLKRAKEKVFEIALANHWETMVTFTLDSEKVDRYDTKEILKPFTKWLHNQANRKNVRYLIVPEEHKDGAIHFHGLCSGLNLASSGTFKCPDSKKPVKLQTLLKKGFKPENEDVKEVFNVKDYKLGFSTAIYLDGNKEAVAKYMTKYITKDLKKIFGNFYFAGGKIERELPSMLVRADFSKIQTPLEFELQNKMGKVKYLTFDSTDEVNEFLFEVI